MHVEKAHEDTDHQTAVMKILVFLHLFNDNDAAVGRSHNHTFCIAFKHTDGTLEKVYQNKVNHHTDSSYDINRNTTWERIEKDSIKEQQTNGSYNQRIHTLVMKSYLLYFL